MSYISIFQIILMPTPECKSCTMSGVCRYSILSGVLFLIGMVTVVEMKVLDPLCTIDPIYRKVSWYLGVTAFLLSLVYKYKALRKSAEVIKITGLKEKVTSSAPLNEDDYTLLSEIVCGQDSWRERLNFFVILTLSMLALVLAMWADLHGPVL